MTASAAAQISATDCQPQASSTNGAQELGHRGADIADAEDAERRALLARRDRSARHRRRRPRRSRRPGRRPARRPASARRCGRRRAGRSPPPRPAWSACRQAGRHSGRSRCRARCATSEPVRTGVPISRPNCGLAQAELLLDAHADDREDRPHGKADGEGDRGHRKRPRAAWSWPGGWVKSVILAPGRRATRLRCSLKTKKLPARSLASAIRDRG